MKQDTQIGNKDQNHFNKLEIHQPQVLLKYILFQLGYSKITSIYLFIASKNFFRAEEALLKYQLCLVWSMMGSFDRASRSSPLPEMRLGKIGCGRQNPPVQSAELPSRIGMAKGMPSTSLQDWKAATAPLLPQKRRWYDAGGFPYRSACTKQPRYAPGCLYPSRWLPWLRRCAQRTQVYLKLMIIRVNLQFLYRRPNQYKRKLSEWDIYIYLLRLDVLLDCCC
ncbi:Hypothetical_protein [Hexamita inflata]|uniref:Hypothetical_protein n=1 Tax=Hexamita inflata TaxID=28002 RepID=A0ABP1GSY8_9EUKA